MPLPIPTSINARPLRAVGLPTETAALDVVLEHDEVVAELTLQISSGGGPSSTSTIRKITVVPAVSATVRS